MVLASNASNVVEFTPPIPDSPPHNIEVEQALLGGLLIDPEAFVHVESILIASEAFFYTPHQIIYRAIATLSEAGTSANLQMVVNYLGDRNLLQKCGGKLYLGQLHSSTLSATNLDALAQVVRDKWVRREMISLGANISRLGHQTHTPITNCIDQVHELVQALQLDSTPCGGALPIDNALMDIFERLSKREKPPVLETGLYDLDALSGGGLRRGNLVIAAGRASMGKTQLAVHLSYQVAINQKQPVVFFSAEMGAEELLCRFLALASGVDSKRLLSAQIYESEWELIASGIGILSDSSLRIDTTSNPSPAHMRTQIKRVQAELGLVGLVALDYLQMLGSSTTNQRWQEVDLITRECKAIAKDFDLPFLALAQVSRAVEGRNNKRPLLCDLRESGAIEQTADLVLMLYRDDYYNPVSPDRGTIEISVAKNRNGSTGTAKFLFDPSLSKFLNLAKR